MGHYPREDGAPDQGRSHPRSGSFGCPLCCLGAASAVLPERVGASVRIARLAETHALYFVLLVREPENLVSPAVNGARAPPRAALA